MEYLESDLESQEWYQNLVDDCRDIIVERGFRARMEVIEGYHELGERIQTDVDFKKWSNKRGEQLDSWLMILRLVTQLFILQFNFISSGLNFQMHLKVLKKVKI